MLAQRPHAAVVAAVLPSIAKVPSLVPCLLAVVLVDAGVPASPAPADARVVLQPTAVTGELPERLREAIDAALLDGLARAGFEPQRSEAKRCDDGRCRAALVDSRGATFVVDLDVQVLPDGDHTVQLRAWAGDGDTPVATAGGRCGLCGFEELVEFTAAKAASLGQTLENSAQAAPQLIIDGSPRGAMLELDGQPRGVGPQTLTVAPGGHVLVIRSPGFVPRELELDAPAGTSRAVTYELVRAAPSPTERHAQAQRRRRTVAGASTIAIGIAGVAAGAALLVLDGRPYRSDCQADANGECRFLYGTRTGGAVAVAIGAAAIAVGVTLCVLGRSDRRAAPHRTRAQLRGAALWF